MTRPIFLISLPRSGSTLLQSMLSVSSHIASCAEPWILLPLLNMRNPGIARAAYFHHTAADAINDFVAQIHGGEATYDSAIISFVRTLYDAAADGSRYFMDKTPRYYLIVPELKRLFPDALFIFLVRHPLAVLASIAETFNRGRFRWFDCWIDWIEGHHCMSQAIQESTESTRVVRYEDLVLYPADTITGLCQWLDIPFSEEMITSYLRNDLPGRMGDKKGIKQYTTVSPQSLDKWRKLLFTSHRKAIARSMIRRLDPYDLQVLGYPAEHLLGEIDTITASRTPDLSGRIDSLLNWAFYHIDFRYLQARYRAAKRGEKYAYGFYRHH